MSILDRFRLDGKRLFITGGSRGLGRAMSLACAEAGADCVLVGREAASLEKTAEEMPLAVWRELMDLNLTSTFLGTKFLGGAMLARGKGGRIINIASINALVAGRKIAGRHYETSKAAVVQFTRATAADWAPHGITVNAILPGGFMTDANLRWKQIHPEVIE